MVFHLESDGIQRQMGRPHKVPKWTWVANVRRSLSCVRKKEHEVFAFGRVSEETVRPLVLAFDRLFVVGTLAVKKRVSNGIRHWLADGLDRKKLLEKRQQ